MCPHGGRMLTPGSTDTNAPVPRAQTHTLSKSLTPTGSFHLGAAGGAAPQWFSLNPVEVQESKLTNAFSKCSKKKKHKQAALLVVFYYL